jgi:hypothetical protein
MLPRSVEPVFPGRREHPQLRLYFLVLWTDSDFSILVISTLENIIDAKNSFSQIGIEANYFGYSPTVSMPLADYEDPCIFLWNYENKSYSNLLFFPKQVTKEMIGYYIGLIH